MVDLEQPAVFTDTLTRFAAGAPSPGTEAALRRVIDEGQRGHIDYSRMSPLMADLLRPQEGRARAIMAALGALKSVTFKATGSDGADVFIAAFQPVRLPPQLRDRRHDASGGRDPRRRRSSCH